MVKKIFLILILIISLQADNCDEKLFSYSNAINKSSHLQINRFLDLLVTQKCGINIVYKDNIAKKVLQGKMPYVRIKDYTLKQILDLILTKKGVFYSLKDNTLELSYFKTKTFKINFISSTRSGQSNLDATDSKVTNTYNFDFWSKIESQITDLINNNFLLDPNYNLIQNSMQQSSNTNSNNFKGIKISDAIKSGNSKSNDSSSSGLQFKPIIDRNTGVIVVTGTMKQLNAVKQFIDNLISSLTKEVLIDVHIYSVELSDSHQTGIDWSQLSVSLTKTGIPLRGKYIGGSESIFNSATFSISGLLNFLSQNGNVNSISNPKIVTLNNQKAIISVGDNIYYKYASKVVTDSNGNPTSEYTVDSKFVGVVLDITPQISDNGEIILSIEPKLSKFRDVTQLSNTNRGMPPDTVEDTMLSVVKLKNNQTLVLGGLITDDKSLSVNGVPVLKEIPLFKYIFSSRDKITTKKELVFVITPHIISINHNKKTLRDLGFGKF